MIAPNKQLQASSNAQGATRSALRMADAHRRTIDILNAEVTLLLAANTDLLRTIALGDNEKIKLSARMDFWRDRCIGELNRQATEAANATQKEPPF